MVLSVLSQGLPYAPYVVVAVVLWLAVNPVARFRYRHIPGPFVWPFLGNLVPILRKGQHIYFTELRAKYGPIFQVWYCGQPWVVISDPDSVRRVAHRIPNRWIPPHTLLGLEKQALEDTLVLLQSSQMWRLLKKVWDPAMLHSSSLEGYAPLMQESIDAMVQQLESTEQQAEVVDLHAQFQGMAMAITVQCAFGINIGGGDGRRGDGWGAEGEELLNSCRGMFRTQQLDHASKWVLPVLMFPSAADWFRGMAYLVPDAGQRTIVQAMRRIVVGARKIVAASRAQRQAAAVPDVKAERDQLRPLAQRSGRGVLPGSFVAQMEAWKAKHAEAADCSDDMIAFQVITFLLGGYDTFATSMAFFVHDLATHPEVQRKAQAELDAVLGGRKPTLDDLPKLVYLEACRKESMRLGGASPYFMRWYNTEGQASVPNLSLLGYPIPAGARIAMYIYTLHRDPQYWQRPQEFLPERFLPETDGKLGPFHDYAYLPFGAGPRKCVGYKFAEQEMALATVALLQHFSFVLPDGAGPLRKKMGLTFTPDGGLKVHVLPRDKCVGS